MLSNFMQKTLFITVFGPGLAAQWFFRKLSKSIAKIEYKLFPERKPHIAHWVFDNLAFPFQRDDCMKAIIITAAIFYGSCIALWLAI